MFRDNKFGVIMSVLLAICIAAIITFLIFNQVRLQEKLDDTEQSLRELTEQNRGPQGPDGLDGLDATDDQVARAVEAYCAAHNGCIGPTGATGATGSTGASGQSVSGAPGASIVRVTCNNTSVSFYDSNGVQVGRVSMVCIP